MEFQPVELFFNEQGQGTPVILLHGFPFNHTIWQPVLPLLAEHARLIMPDLRGFGQSPVTDGVYSMRLMAEDVVALMDKMGLEKAVLVGHSMGGYVSLAFAQAYPNRLLGLGLIATQAAADLPEKRQGRLKTASSVKRRGVKVVAQAMAPKLTPKTELVQPMFDLMMRANRLAVIGALQGMAERSDLTGELSEIHVPAVVVAGGQDQFLTQENMRTMAQMLPKCWLVEIPEGGHMPMLETPERVAESIHHLVHTVHQ
jgi:pimeloyl-ACP methyl ester carboxylesterase